MESPKIVENVHPSIAQLQGIHEELKAAGVIVDPSLPIAGVRLLIEERRQMLEEMARAVPIEKLATAVAGDPPADPPLGPRCENCDAVLCLKCNRCHGGIDTGSRSGCALSRPPCGPRPASALGCLDCGRPLLLGDGVCGPCHRKATGTQTPHELERERDGDILPGAVRIAHEALISVIVTSERDWTRAADLAWLYGVLVGWSDDDLSEFQIRFGWRDPTVAIIKEHRAALICAGMAE